MVGRAVVQQVIEAVIVVVKIEEEEPLATLVKNLPTKVIVKADGRVHDFHVGREGDYWQTIGIGRIIQRLPHKKVCAWGCGRDAYISLLAAIMNVIVHH